MSFYIEGFLGGISFISLVVGLELLAFYHIKNPFIESRHISKEAKEILLRIGIILIVASIPVLCFSLINFLGLF